MEPEVSDSDVVTELPADSSSFRPAFLHERFSAFFTDTVILAHLLIFWSVLLKHLAHEDVMHPFEFSDNRFLFFLTTGSAIYFLYYLFFEGVLTTTPGKFLGGLSIKNTRKETPSLFSILVRNVFRVIDYPLFILTSIGLMEATSKHQRLGDFIGRVMVVRKLTFESRRIPPSELRFGSSNRRALATFLDLILLAVFSYGLLLLIPTNRRLVSMACLSLVPISVFLYFTLSETFFQTTFGKSLLGLKIVQEDGRPPRFSTLLFRNFCRIADLNPIGYFCSVFSSRKQGLADLVSGTVVVKNRKGWRGWMSIPFMLIAAGTVGYFGYLNPESFFKKDYEVSLVRHQFDPIPLAVQRLNFDKIHLENFEFGFNETDINERGVYDAGNIAYLLFTVSGQTLRKNRSWIQADVKVHDSQQNVILDRANILNTSVIADKYRPSHLMTRFALHPQTAPGLYEVTLSVRDLFGNTTVEEKKILTVRP